MRIHLATSPEDVELLEACAFAHGRTYVSYLATEPGRECFFSSDRRGCVAVVRKRRYLFVAGGLLAPEERQAGLLSELLTAIADTRTNCQTMNARTYRDGLAVVDLVLSIRNREHLQYLIQRIMRVRDIYRVSRASESDTGAR
jgi:hypothetical protein